MSECAVLRMCVCALCAVWYGRGPIPALCYGVLRYYVLRAVLRGVLRGVLRAVLRVVLRAVRVLCACCAACLSCLYHTTLLYDAYASPPS